MEMKWIETWKDDLVENKRKARKEGVYKDVSSPLKRNTIMLSLSLSIFWVSLALSEAILPKMVNFSTLALGFAVIASSLAAPTPEELPPHVERRGPHNFFLGPDHPLMLARRNVSLEARTNYVQDYTTGGTVNFTPSGSGFSLNFNTQEDFVVGVGWNPGSTAFVTTTTVFLTQLISVVPSLIVVRSVSTAV
jgi:hypothetical protein